MHLEIPHGQMHRVNRGEHGRVRDAPGKRAHRVRGRHVRMHDLDRVLAHDGDGVLDRVPAQLLAHGRDMDSNIAVAQRLRERAFERTKRRQPEGLARQALREAQHGRFHSTDDRVAGDDQHAKRCTVIGRRRRAHREAS